MDPTKKKPTMTRFAAAEAAAWNGEDRIDLTGQNITKKPDSYSNINSKQQIMRRRGGTLSLSSSSSATTTKMMLFLFVFCIIGFNGGNGGGGVYGYPMMVDVPEDSERVRTLVGRRNVYLSVKRLMMLSTLFAILYVCVVFFIC